MRVHKFLLLDTAVDPPVTHVCETLNRVPRVGTHTKTLCGEYPTYSKVEKAQNMCPKCREEQNNIFSRPIAPNGEGALSEEDSISRE